MLTIVPSFLAMYLLGTRLSGCPGNVPEDGNMDSLPPDTQNKIAALLYHDVAGFDLMQQNLPVQTPSMWYKILTA